MVTSRGYVEWLEVGRAGQAAAQLLLADGSRATFTISDLDGDPERFNERLSKLALLREAMDRAEPVEVETQQRKAGGGPIDRVRRLTRDALAWPGERGRATGIVIGVRLEIVAAPELPEPTDRGTLALLVDGAVERFAIPMQTPERVTAAAMAAMAREAQANGSLLTVDYDSRTRIVAALEVGAGGLDAGRGGEEIDAFVETISHAPWSDLMAVRLTTAPSFSGDGRFVPLQPFVPEERAVVVLRGAPEYALLEAALRDTLRVRVLAAGAPAPDGNAAGAAEVRLATHADGPARPAGLELVRGVELLAPLCSASRPVWIQVDRRALDFGPRTEECIEGLPTSDLRPRSLRELDLPYRAEWIGIGCFNHGVYRFELALSGEFTIFVDGRELCPYRGDAGGNVRYAHACLDGDHEVRIVIDAWHCSKQFDLNVYRIR